LGDPDAAGEQPHEAADDDVPHGGCVYALGKPRSNPAFAREVRFAVHRCS